MALYASAPGPRVPLYRTGSYQTNVPANASLFESASQGNKSGAEAALKQGAKALGYFEGSTAAHSACEANAPGLVELLMASYVADVKAAGGDDDEATAVSDFLNARTDANQTTLLAAASGAGAKEVMALLLAKGATATDANSFGSTCLHMAARAPQQASACVALLLAHGAGESVQVANNRGSSPLHFAAFAKPESEAVATVKALAAVGADPNAADLEGSTPLFAAANLKSASLVTALLEAGADPRRADFNGRTPVDLAETLVGTSPSKQDSEILALLRGAGNESKVFKVPVS